MNLICLSRITPQHDVKGGMENHLAMLAEGLVGRGHSVTVVTTRRSDGFVGIETVHGVRYWYTETPRVGYFATWQPDWYRSSLKILETLDQEQRIDVVWAEGGGAYGAMGVLRKLNVPYVPIAQGTIPGDWQSYVRQAKSVMDYLKFVGWLGIKSYYLLRYELRYIRQAARYIVVSDELKRDVMRYYRIPGEHIEVVYNGVPSEKFFVSREYRTEIRQKLKIAEDGIVLFVAGRLIREKGFHLVVEAFARLTEKYPKARLVIGGKGKFEEELRLMINDLGINDRVHFVGFIEHDQIAKYYNAADVFVSPTLRVEGFPLTFCEAMLCGLPVVASRLGGNPSAVKHEQTGLLLDEVAVDDLVQKLDRIVGDAAFRQQLAQNAKELAEREFTQEVMVGKTEKIFKEILNSKH